MKQVRSISHNMGPYNQISTYNEVHNLYNIVLYERKSNQLIQNHIVSYFTILYNTIQYPYTPINTTLYQYALSCYCIMPCDLLSYDAFYDILPQSLTRFSTILHH